VRVFIDEERFNSVFQREATEQENGPIHVVPCRGVSTPVIQEMRPSAAAFAVLMKSLCMQIIGSQKPRMRVCLFHKSQIGVLHVKIPYWTR
jgi:hypothetical protein